jgi:hypothetical protein
MLLEFFIIDAWVLDVFRVSSAVRFDTRRCEHQDIRHREFAS